MIFKNVNYMQDTMTIILIGKDVK